MMSLALRDSAITSILILRSVASFCKSLRELTLLAVTLFHLADSCFWKKMGKTLEVLNLEFQDDAEDECWKIKKYCRNLKYIWIRSQEYDGVRGLSDCLGLYGGQLEYATIRNMKLEELKQVVDKCSNARLRHVKHDGNYGEYLGLVRK